MSLHVLPYFDIRDELVVQGMIVFKGHQLVVPAALRKEMMAATHNSHIGIEACICGTRESLYWPRMTVELKEYIQHCDVCFAHRNKEGKEPLAQHDFAARPWSKVAADLCQLKGRTLLVISDYYSNFIKVACVTAITVRSIIKELKAVLARFGIPDILVADNRPQFASSEFSFLARTWEFKHVTSSQTYAQWNGKAEKAMKTVKHLQILWPVLVSGSTRLAKLSHRRHWNEPSAKADGKAVQNTTTSRGQTFTAKVRHRRRGLCTTGSKAAPEVSLQLTHKTS